MFCFSFSTSPSFLSVRVCVCVCFSAHASQSCNCAHAHINLFVVNKMKNKSKRNEKLLFEESVRSNGRRNGKKIQIHLFWFSLSYYDYFYAICNGSIRANNKIIWQIILKCTFIWIRTHKIHGSIHLISMVCDHFVLSNWIANPMRGKEGAIERKMCSTTRESISN